MNILAKKQEALILADKLIINSYKAAGEPTERTREIIKYNSEFVYYFLSSKNGLCKADNLTDYYDIIEPLYLNDNELHNLNLNDLFLKVINILNFNVKVATKENKELEILINKLESLKDSN